MVANKSDKGPKGGASGSGSTGRGGAKPSLIDDLLNVAGRITGSIVDVVKAGSAIPLSYSDGWLKDLYIKSLDPERLRAMAEAGEFLRDARKVAGLNLRELAEALGLNDTELLEEVESGRATLPFDMILRIASLVARHDPIPFILKFVRTYNPALEQRLDEWGISRLPRQYERERRFTNLLRRHDLLREMSDEEFDRFLAYQKGALDYALSIMQAERGGEREEGGDER